MDKLKNGFDHPGIKLVYGFFPVTHSGKKVTFPADKYKPIRIKKKSGVWPDQMSIKCDINHFDFIFPEIIQHEKNNEIYFSISQEYRSKINSFEIQIKKISPNGEDQGTVSVNDPDTTVTIGDAPPGDSSGNKKKKK
jgi:hypothetical protein